MKNGWSKKKKIWVIVAIVVIAALIGTVLYIAFKPEKAVNAEIINVKSGNITETYDTTATIESGKQASFDIYDGVVVKKLNVRVGDSVKKGDVLATFDTSALGARLEEKRVGYSTAQKAYNDYLNNSYSSSQQLTSINKQVDSLENEVAALEKKVSNTKKPSSSASQTTTKAETPTVKTDDLEEVRTALKEVLGNTKLGDKIADRLLSSDSSSAQLVAAIKKMISSTGSFDMSAMSSLTSSMVSEDEKNLITKELQLVQLKVQQTVLSAQSGESLKSVYKTLASSAKEAYDEFVQKVDVLEKGWIAEEDGFVREINIEEGKAYESPDKNSNPGFDMSAALASVTSGSFDLSSIVSTLFGSSQKGLVLEYYPLVAAFELGKYDISKISMDQKVKVTASSGEDFEGTVTYISPVATASSGINISSIMGGSSSSSSASTVTAKVTIDKPDRSVIIGMDVEISVDLETKNNVMLIPVESIQYDNDSGYYVYKYNSEKETIEKKTVKTGLFDGENYQITSGLKLDDTIVRAPTTAMTDGQHIAAMTK